MARDSNVGKDLDFFAGDDRTIRWTIFDADPLGTPLDITGMNFQFVLKKNHDDAVALVSKPGVIFDAANGLVDVTLEDTDTQDFAEDNYVYALRRVDAGDERVAAVGNFYIRRASLA